jgi:hypothetical protein
MFPGARDVRDHAGELLARAHDLLHVVRPRPTRQALGIDLLVRVGREPLVRIGDADVPAVSHAEPDVRELRHQTAVANA